MPAYLLRKSAKIGILHKKLIEARAAKARCEYRLDVEQYTSEQYRRTLASKVGEQALLKCGNEAVKVIIEQVRAQLISTLSNDAFTQKAQIRVYIPPLEFGFDVDQARRLLDPEVVPLFGLRPRPL